MGLVREYLVSIEGVYVFAVISLLIFFFTFLVMIIHAFMLKKEQVNEYGNLPLEDEDANAAGNES